MKSGYNLSRKLILQKRSDVSDGAGGFEANWEPIGSLWGDVVVQAARARETSLNDASLVRLKIAVRSAPVGSSMRPIAGQRFVEGTRIYNIDAVSDADELGLYLTCWAKEEVGK